MTSKKLSKEKGKSTANNLKSKIKAEFNKALNNALAKENLETLFQKANEISKAKNERIAKAYISLITSTLLELEKKEIFLEIYEKDRFIKEVGVIILKRGFKDAKKFVDIYKKSLLGFNELYKKENI